MNIKKIRSKGTLLGMVAACLVIGAAGGTLVDALAAHAQSIDTPTVVAAQTATTSPSIAPKNNSSMGGSDEQSDPSKGGHVGANGTKEELLTGDIAQKVKAAALAAVPGGTIQRVETDAEGSPYEAHMTKSDGSQVTVKVDSNLNVTSTDTGRS